MLTTGAPAMAAAMQFVSISAGAWFTCGATSAFAVWCWGDGTQGTLGTATEQSVVPVQISGIGGTIRIGQVSTGLAHACGVTVPPDGGKIYCWGSNVYDSLGNGATEDSNFPKLAKGPELFTSVEAGTMLTCAHSVSNTVYCWGRNFSGEVGIASAADFVTVPTKIAAPSGLRFGGVSAEGVHAGAIANATGETGDVYCWGMNDDGRLGDGTNVGRPSPVRVVQ